MTTPAFLLTTPIHLDIENPTAQQIADLLQKLPVTDPNDDYLILNKPGAEFCGISVTYLQTRPHRAPKYEEMFLIEYRDGLAGRHFRGAIKVDAVAKVFESYLNDDGAWLEMLTWRDISYQFDDLRAALPAEEFAASFFPEGQWEESLEKKKQRDENSGNYWARTTIWKTDSGQSKN
jgi:hypothetical protein